MKISLLIITILLVSGVSYFIYLAYLSHQAESPGLTDSKQLTRCPDSPNCINTEYSDDTSHYAPPLSSAELTDTDAMQNILQAIKQTGGEVHLVQQHYIAATYTSRLFRFVDDMEIRLDTKTKQIHLRSASRQGHSDMGANLKRVNKIKQAFIKQQKTLEK